MCLRSSLFLASVEPRCTLSNVAVIGYVSTLTPIAPAILYHILPFQDAHPGVLIIYAIERSVIMYTGPQRYTPPQKMNLIHVHRNIEVRILAGLTGNPLQCKRDIANQNLPVVLRREYLGRPSIKIRTLPRTTIAPPG